MSDLITPTRRGFLLGLGASLVVAPAIVRATSIMPVKALPPAGASYALAWWQNVQQWWDQDTRLILSDWQIENLAKPAGLRPDQYRRELDIPTKELPSELRANWQPRNRVILTKDGT